MLLMISVIVAIVSIALTYFIIKKYFSTSPPPPLQPLSSSSPPLTTTATSTSSNNNPVHHLPPGPPRNSQSSSSSPATITSDYLHKLYEEYGPIVYLQHNNKQHFLLLNTLDVIRQCMEINEFCGGTFHQNDNDDDNLPLTSSSSSSRGIVYTTGDICRQNRRWCLQEMRKIRNNGRSAIEMVVLQETIALCQYLNDHLINHNSSSSIDTLNLFTRFSIDTIDNLVFGEHNSYKTNKSPPTVGGEQAVELMNIQCKIQEYRCRNNGNNSTMIHSSNEQMEEIIHELYEQGVDTMAATLSWAILLLAKNPKILTRMREEIHAILPPTAQVTMSDKKQFHYCLAVMDEIMRFSTVLPFGIGHTVVEDAKIDDFDIPKGTRVLLNLFSLHHDSELWERPNNFYPKHFLFADGETYCPQDNFLPFGYGKRSCLGESFAQIQFFIVLITLIQRYSFTLDETKENLTDKLINLKGSFGQIHMPGQHNIIFQNID